VHAVAALELSLVPHGVGEVDHVAVPDGGRQRVDGHEAVVDVVQLDRIVAIYPGVGRPEHQLTACGIHEPLASK
jgi:hypothetical protein